MTDTVPVGDPLGDLYLSAPCGLLTTTVDGVITSVNDTILEWTGHSRQDLVGTAFRSHLDPGSQLFYETRYTPLLHLEREVREVALVFLRADGERKPVLLNAVIRDAEGGSYAHLAIFDASVRQEYEREMLAARRLAEASEIRVRALQEMSSALEASVSETEVCEALVRSASAAFAPTATGVFLLNDEGTLELTAGTNPLAGLVPTERPVGAQRPRVSDIALSEDRTVTVTVETPDDRHSHTVAALRSVRLESVSVIPLRGDGEPLGVLACFFGRAQELDSRFTDLQSALSRLTAQALVRVRLQRQLARLALHDQLTGLANRTLIQQTVDAAVSVSLREASSMSVIFLDLDGFKRINDQLGHAAGDSVLSQVAARIRSGVRQEDAVGRYGGDEFVVICAGADAEESRNIAHRVCDLVRMPLDGIPEEMRVTASVGIAVYLPTDETPPTNDELLRLADDAMYLSKSEGKDRVSFLHR